MIAIIVIVIVAIAGGAGFWFWSSRSTSGGYTLMPAGQEHAGADLGMSRDVTIEQAQEICNNTAGCVAISYDKSWVGPKNLYGGAIFKSDRSINNTGFGGQFYTKNA